ncbi:MAG: Xaa-Pro peptidase family protein [Chloroherpetonaceae bacterium]|nr:Xaa-Pro peptidase family protein [Chthonomonadaceae bacterium]MDW8206658.1 Xaa-Pro peptidase family protein [Chloroherpetonaceae bacterium]
MSLTAEKLQQATQLVALSEADVWLTFVRETIEGGDPVLPLILEGGLTWQSALLIGRNGRRVAIVGSYDAGPLLASDEWDEVIPYVHSIREPLIHALDTLIPVEQTAPRIAINYSVNDVKADGLSYGLYLLLTSYLQGTRYADSLISAEEIVMALRGLKTPLEIARIQKAIAATEQLFAEIADFARPGRTEYEVYAHVQHRMHERGLGFAWDQTGDPIVNSGPDSMPGHGVPSRQIAIAPGHILHVDLGVTLDGYSSDIQRCWYVPHPGENTLPEDVQRAFEAVTGAISAGAAALRPGVAGWQVDAVARHALVQAGYPEYLHAFGHQVGRMAHDGGAILGPRWERYGRTPVIPVRASEVYTLELGVNVPGRGYLGIEEMVEVTENGCRWLTTRQMELPLLR